MRTNSTNPTIFQGGKNGYGAAVGILMLETSFPRVLGDIGNAATWPFPVMYRVVPDASPDHVVRRRGEGLLEAFISAGRDMVRHGADGITTNCGFLALFQDELATALGVPVATSSLMQVPFVERMLPAGKRVGVLTISAASLTADHLKAQALPRTLPSSAPTPDATSVAPFLKTKLNWTWKPPGSTSLMPVKRCSNVIQTLGRWCWNAPTWCPAPPICAGHLACPCTRFTRC